MRRRIGFLCVVFVICLQSAKAQERTAREIRVDSVDAREIQIALDSLTDAGGVVYLPPGEIEISEPLSISTPETRLSGGGPATHIKNLNEKGRPAILIRPVDRSTDANAKMWRVQLDNFRVSGNPKSGSGVHAVGIEEIYLHGLSVDHHGGHGVELVDCYEDPRISDSILTYNRQVGLLLDRCHDVIVSANQFEENDIAVRCVDSFNLCMNGNNLDDHLADGIVIENTYGSEVTGNMIEECQGTAVVLDSDCYGIAISANVIAHHRGGGVDLRDAHGCTISANAFTLVHEFGVRVSPDSSRLTISGNNFSNSYIGGGKHKRLLKHDNQEMIDTGSGVILESTSHILVGGNTFSGLDGPAVRALGDCRKILISGNVATDLNRRVEDKSAESNVFDIAQESDVTLTNNVAD